MQQRESMESLEILQGQEASACVMKLIKESSDRQIELAGEENTPVVSAACQDFGKGKRENIVFSKQMPVTTGNVNDCSVSVLRDSGCSGAVIRHLLVRDEHLSVLQQFYILIDGTVRRVDEEEVDVQTPFFNGMIKAMCMEKPIYDLIIGNIPGVRGPEVLESNNGNEKPHKENERLSDVSRKILVEKREDKLDSNDKLLQVPDKREKVGAVQTSARVAAEHQRQERPLKTPEIKVKDVTPAQFRKDQREDETLRTLFEKGK